MEEESYAELLRKQQELNTEMNVVNAKLPSARMAMINSLTVEEFRNLSEKVQREVLGLPASDATTVTTEGKAKAPANAKPGHRISRIGGRIKGIFVKED